MSCDDCNKVVDMLHAVIDGEASCEELNQFNEHLDRCVKCSDHVQNEKRLFEEIKSKIKTRSCPEALLSSVMGKIKKLVK